ncbi:hypothetical protein LCGC14_0745200 [marine sediment metagenome]|uniref:Rubredoxin-like domain-containing protein n=1 Tax=marine sediment metagenome TaxID=412755 RepID=A0A0F9QQD7_9ZZZZ
MAKPGLRKWPMIVTCGACGHKWTELGMPFIVKCPKCGYSDA